MFFILPVFAQKDYYIKKDTKFNIQYMCFSENECYPLSPETIEVKKKKFINFIGFDYYDLETFKYDKKNDIYKVDMIVDKNPIAVDEYNTKCPYDKGYITNLIFNITYSPSKDELNATYKGFISSKVLMNHNTDIYFRYLNIYYDNNTNLIKEFNEYRTNKNSNTFPFRAYLHYQLYSGLRNGNSERTLSDMEEEDIARKKIEIEYILPYYIHNHTKTSVNK